MQKCLVVCKGSCTFDLSINQKLPKMYNQVSEEFMCTLTNFNACLTNIGLEPMDKNEAHDWIQGGESIAQLQEMANDLKSELETSEAECREYAKNGDPIYGEPMEDEY